MIRCADQISATNERGMEGLPANIGVFFGRVDKRSEGWYWTDAESPTKVTGPFETKAQAAENARQSLGLSHQQSHD
jgi:hypothetical protein